MYIPVAMYSSLKPFGVFWSTTVRNVNVNIFDGLLTKSNTWSSWHKRRIVYDHAKNYII